MPHVQVTIAGHGYRMACGEGEEEHLLALAEIFDGKIAEMRAAFGEIGDLRLHVMAALTLADEAAEQGKRLAALAGQAATSTPPPADTPSADPAPSESDGRIADALASLAERVERIALSLVSPAPADHG